MNYPENMNPRWAWHYDTLLALREILVLARDDRRSSASAAIEREGADSADRASTEADRAVALAELDAEEAELGAVDEALARLRNGTYGICVRTGKRISSDRLHALPWTPYSREAAGQVEQNSGAPGRTAKRLRWPSFPS